MRPGWILASLRHSTQLPQNGKQHKHGKQKRNLDGFFHLATRSLPVCHFKDGFCPLCFLLDPSLYHLVASFIHSLQALLRLKLKLGRSMASDVVWGSNSACFCTVTLSSITFWAKAFVQGLGAKLRTRHEPSHLKNCEVKAHAFIWSNTSCSEPDTINSSSPLKFNLKIELIYEVNSTFEAYSHPATPTYKTYSIL